MTLGQSGLAAVKENFSFTAIESNKVMSEQGFNFSAAVKRDGFGRTELCLNEQ